MKPVQSHVAGAIVVAVALLGAPVTPVRAADPAPASAAAVVARAVDAMGGADIVDNVSTLVVTTDHVRRLERGDAKVSTTTYFSFPLQVRHELHLGGKSVALVSTPDGGVMVTPEGTVDLTPQARLAAETPAMRNPVALLKARHGRKVSFADRGTMRADGRELRLVEMRVGPHVTMLGFDADSGRLLQQSYAAAAGDDVQGEIVIRYDDFRRTPQGLVYPFASRAEVAGRVLSESRVTGVRVNEKLDATLFPPPEGKEDPARRGESR